MTGLLKTLFGRRTTPPATEQPEFGAVLEQAVRRSGDPRRDKVVRLAAIGAEEGAIARDTRLARDAVRSVLGSS